MSKATFCLYVYVTVVTVANICLWQGVVGGGSAPRSGKIVGLIILLAVGALFADKFSNNQFAPTFIRAGSLIGMTLLFLILLNR